MTAVTHSSTEPPSTGPRAGARVRAGKIVANLSTAALYEAAVRDGEGMIAAEGPLVVSTGTHTGRSPKDKFIVREPSSEANIWWGDVNHEISVPRGSPPVQPGPVHRRPSQAPALAAGLHGDRLGEHLRAQPLSPPDGR
jgi:Phosphoenolpyruvate carboxykinase